MDLIQKTKNLGCVIKNDKYYLWEIQKWLREVYNIDIDITRSNITGTYKITLWKKSMEFNGDHYVPKIRIGVIETYTLYEEALKTGLQESLKLIKI